MSTNRGRDATETKVGPGTSGTQPKIRWDDSNMRSSYANVCNVAGTREEVVLLFGINQNWNSAQNELTVQLAERIIISPFAAKRLVALLANAVNGYEARFGPLDATVPSPSEPGEK